MRASQEGRAPTPHFGMRTHRKLKWLLWAMALLVFAVYGLRAFVADVYPIESSSMEPELFPGDWVLVKYDKSMPARGELVVVEGQGGSPIVKRVGGLPGERLLLTPDGDILIQGKGERRLERGGLDRPGPPLVAVFDPVHHDVAEHFAHGSSRLDPWTPIDGAWQLDGRDLEAGSHAGYLRHHKGIHNDLVKPDGTLELGQYSVGDAAVACDVWPSQAGGELVLQLVERGDTFLARFDLGDPVNVRVTLERITSAGLGVDVTDGQLEEAVSALPLQTWTSLRFLNIDNHLRVEVNGAAILDHRYPSNRDGGGPGGISTGERVLLGGVGCQVRFRDIHVFRDVHNTQRGEFGVNAPVLLGPGELFLLGDNSSVSQDSREFGPVSIDRLIGRVTRVVWPRDRARVLESTR
jgi:signal peptidase I